MFQFFQDAGALKWLYYSLAAITAYVLVGSFYRLYLSPLAKFPGRKMSILTLWYEFYYQAIKGGKFIWEVEKMHQEYGPIVRINPYELHINDPDYYDELYNFKHYEKYQWHVQQFGHPDSSANTVTHHMHKMRRSVVAPYFARGAILSLEASVIQRQVEKLCKRIEECKSNKPMPLGTAFRALTTDVITEYTMGESFGFLERDDFHQQWFDEFLRNVRMVHTVMQYPWLPNFSKRLPTWLKKTLFPGTSNLVAFHHVVQEEVVKSKNTPKDDQKLNPTLFREIFQADIPASEKTIDRVTDEGVLFVVAGNETTGNALSIIAYNILKDPAVHAKLRKELVDLIPDARTIAKWQTLEKAPYLSAVIKEGLRLSYGVVSRMPRVVPDRALRYKDWEIPPNTPVSMSNWLTHNDPNVYNNPLAFQPERWLKGQESEKLDHYFVPFCRGTRMCTGMNLAYAEMYVTVATIFRRFDMQLFQTTFEDIDVAHEFHIPQVKQDSKGVQVLVK
ncbi:MAG: hypothetical protein M1828_006401 [Chrysothrix sp. TS-e1954]|nr:MAG: hypothetical protein M1828_006401 [Chrysothrix sp. TS-e1954]